jgi:hypothetical protein
MPLTDEERKAFEADNRDAHDSPYLRQRHLAALARLRELDEENKRLAEWRRPEEKPPEAGFYLATINRANGSRISNSVFWWGSYWDSPIVAWCPLPEPMEGEFEEKTP